MEKSTSFSSELKYRVNVTIWEGCDKIVVKGRRLFDTPEEALASTKEWRKDKNVESFTILKAYSTTVTITKNF